MGCVRFWDYIMRRKLLMVMAIGVVCSAVLSCNFLIAQHKTVEKNSISENSSREVSRVETPNLGGDDTMIAMINHGLAIKVFGENQEEVAEIRVESNFQRATVKLNSGLLASPAYLRILGGDGGLVAGEYTDTYDRANGTIVDGETAKVFYFFPGTPKSYQIDLAVGMQIEIQAEQAKVYGLLDNTDVSAMAPRLQTERYVVMQNGLRRMDMSEGTAEEILYQLWKSYALREIAIYQSEVPEYILHNKLLDQQKKNEVCQLYEGLTEADRLPYQDFVEQLKRGGVPVINYHGKLEYAQGEGVDILDFVNVKDNEDREIARENWQVEGVVEFDKPGKYMVIIRAQDSDANWAERELEITVTEVADGPIKIPGIKPSDKWPTEGNDGNNNDADDGNNSADGGSDGDGGDKTDDNSGLSQEVINGGSANTADQAGGATQPDQGTNAADAQDISGTVWEGVERAVDYENRNRTNQNQEAEQTEKNAERNRGQDVASKVTSGANGESLAKTESGTENYDDTHKTQNWGAALAWVAGGIVAIAGLVKFIFDHYIR